jgi:saccharopine dehydrogenase (NAD+, L-lysine-forming)
VDRPAARGAERGGAARHARSRRRRGREPVTHGARAARDADLAGVEAARRILAGEAKPGFQTPATAFGADFVLALPGVKREDLT